MRRAPSRILAALRRNIVVLATLAIAVVYAIIAARLHLKQEVGIAIYAPISLIWAGLLLRRLRVERGTAAILISGLILYYLYLTYTGPGERNYDGPEQLDKYIGYIVENHRIPPAKKGEPGACFICHHPPLYYVLGAIAQVTIEATRIASKPISVQLFSLAIFFGFLVYGVKLAQLFSDDRRTVRITAALLVFWPYSIHNSVRVHNDTLVTTLVCAGMYYAARWYKEGKPRHLYAAGLCAALGVLTKSSAYALVAILGIMLAWRFFTRSNRLRLLRRGTLAIAMSVAAFGALKLREPVADDPCHRTFGTACDIRKSDYTGNKPINYLYVDVPMLLRDPYMRIHDDSSGKQYFWMHVFKSSLFGTHNKIPDRETTYSLNRKLGFFMGIGLFAMLVYSALAGLAGIRRGLRKWAIPLLYVVVSALFLMAFKIAIPAPHHTDFRHIYFGIAPACLLFAAAVGHMRSRHRLLGSLGTLIYLPFVLASIVYFLPKYELVMAHTKETVELPIAAVKKIVPEWTPWDRDGNTLIEGNETLALIVSPPAKVENIDTTLDGNDVYELKIYGKGAPRTIMVRPKKNAKQGVGRYALKVDPPMEEVTRITVRPVSGDRVYSLGHLVIE